MPSAVREIAARSSPDLFRSGIFISLGVVFRVRGKLSPGSEKQMMTGAEKKPVATKAAAEAGKRVEILIGHQCCFFGKEPARRIDKNPHTLPDL